MLNKLTSFVQQYQLILPGDRIICALSGGADSVALTFALYLLKEKLNIQLEAAHFNHHLRGEESDQDEAFVKEFCHRYDIPLHLGGSLVTAGEKGLEAAAREARYGFLRSLPGKIATAHTADDNAETVLMHLIRGAGLKGLGGIMPVSGNVIRPMLSITRVDVEAFLQEFYVNHIEDSSNESDLFLRNRIRHRVMPLLKQENPKLAENVSAMALRLRQDEDFLRLHSGMGEELTVTRLRQLHSAQRGRYLEWFLKEKGLREPEQAHIAQAEALIFSEKPSACSEFPGGVTISRSYDRLVSLTGELGFAPVVLPCPGAVEIAGYRVTCEPAQEPIHTPQAFTVCPQGQILLRSRESGDVMRLSGGSKSLKKLYIDRKIPAHLRSSIPVAVDEQGVLGVCGIGPNRDRISGTGAVTIRFEKKRENGG